MQIQIINGNFSVCQVTDLSQVKLDAKYCFLGKTDAERSLVCLTEDVPENVIQREDGWRAFRICGTLDFSLVGILAKIAGLLAENGISIFAVSTYDTDYVLTKEENHDRAMEVLQKAGYAIVSGHDA